MGLFSGLGNLVSSFAGPILGTVGTAIGGPFGGAIGTTLGSALGNVGGFVGNNFGSIAQGIGGYFGAQETNAANREIAELTTAANERMAANANQLSRDTTRETNTLNYRIASEVTQQQLEEAARNRDFQERMSSSAYQRARADMERAGLNPILAYQQGGASSPSGSVGQVAQARAEPARVYQASAAQAAPHVSKLGAGIASAVQAMEVRQALLKSDAETSLTWSKKYETLAKEAELIQQIEKLKHETTTAKTQAAIGHLEEQLKQLQLDRESHWGSGYFGKEIGSTGERIGKSLREYFGGESGSSAKGFKEFFDQAARERDLTNALIKEEIERFKAQRNRIRSATQ